MSSFCWPALPFGFEKSLCYFANLHVLISMLWIRCQEPAIPQSEPQSRSQTQVNASKVRLLLKVPQLSAWKPEIRSLPQGPAESGCKSQSGCRRSKERQELKVKGQPPCWLTVQIQCLWGQAERARAPGQTGIQGEHLTHPQNKPKGLWEYLRGRGFSTYTDWV